MFMYIIWRLVSVVPTAGLAQSAACCRSVRSGFPSSLLYPFRFLCFAICYDTKNPAKAAPVVLLSLNRSPPLAGLCHIDFLRQGYACFCVASCSFSMSARDFDLVTSHTPRQTSMTASPWLGLNTPMPVSMLTVTDTSGCT